MDVVARMHGGGVVGAGRRAAPRHLARAARGRPEPARRAQAPRLPDARRARQGAQEGRPQEGPQAAAVLQALDAARRGSQAVRHRRRPRRRRRAAHRRARARARPRRDRAARDGRRRAAARCSSSATRASRARCSRPRWPPGVAAAGGDVLLGGVLPTPAAPLLVGRYGLDLAVVICASHNPYRDNGIKFFGADGFKLSDATEARRSSARLDEAPRPPRGDRARRARCTAPHEDYLRALHDALRRPRPRGLDVAARLRQRRDLPRRPGDLPPPRRARHGPRATRPTGATSTTAAARRTSTRSPRPSRDGGHDVGFAFDGDGDRVLAVDRNGVVVDGDELIALAALHLRAHGRAAGRRRRRDGHDELRLPRGDARARASRSRRRSVGDRYVLEELRERGWALGGEQSGHIIDLGFAPSGDGIASALLTLEALAGGDLAERSAMEQAAAAARQRPRGRPRRRDGAAPSSPTAIEREARGAGGPRPRARAPERHRAARARHGRGADGRGGRGRLRAPRRRRRASRPCRRDGVPLPPGWYRRCYRRTRGPPRRLRAVPTKGRGHVRHRRLRRPAAGPGAPARRPARSSSTAATTRPGISVIAGERDRVGARGRQPRATCARPSRRRRRRRTPAASPSPTRAGHDRHRPHPLGHPRPRQRGERPPALRHDRPRPRRRQRDRRELPRAQGAA